MKVLNFSKDLFDQYLREHIAPPPGDKVLILGIADGGIPIADYISNFYLDFYNIIATRENIKCQRPSTKQKKSSDLRKLVLRKIFSSLPLLILNYLRIIEHRKLSQRRSSDTQRNIEPHGIDFRNYDLIWVIDDAVDSGASLLAVINHIKSHALILPNTLKSLVITVTQKNPLIEPDFTQFRDILIRFPWSLDAKE